MIYDGYKNTALYGANISIKWIIPIYWLFSERMCQHRTTTPHWSCSSHNIGNIEQFVSKPNRCNIVTLRYMYNISSTYLRSHIEYKHFDVHITVLYFSNCAQLTYDSHGSYANANLIDSAYTSYQTRAITCTSWVWRFFRI